MMKHGLSFVLLLSLFSIFADAEEIQLGTINVSSTQLEEVLEEKVEKQSSELAKRSQGETLGDFLKNEQFVDSASYGPAVGRPVVRGMDSYRVGVMNGNVILNDLSAMSQDHAVGILPRASEKIQLLKGPSSLLYGNYSGGVIRVLGEEHESKLLKQGYHLELNSEYGSNGAGLSSGGIVRLSDHNLSFYGNTFYHDAQNYKDGSGKEVKDSDTMSIQSHAVLGYQYDKNNIWKLYIDELHKEYGIPNSTLASTSIDMNQEGYGVVWHNKELFDGVNSMQTQAQTSDYLHYEYEGTRADGLFGQKQSTISSIIDFDAGIWNIKVSAEYTASDLQVCHEHGKCTKFFDADRTAIEDGVELQKNIDNLGLPYAHGHPMPNISESTLKGGVAFDTFLDDDNEFMATVHFESRTLDPDSKNIQEIWLVTPAIDPNYYNTINDQALSLSVGLAGFLSDAFSYQTSLSYIERLPSSTELFWNGFHHATDSYIFGDRYLKNEKSLNFDLDLMYSAQGFTTRVGGFYYRFYNYIYQEPLADANGTLMHDPFHNSDVWAIRGVAAKVYGIAFKESYKYRMNAHTFQPSVSFEAIRGILDAGGNIPRMSPYNATFELEHAYKKYKATISYKYVDESRFEAKNETKTPAYSWVSLYVSYDDTFKYGKYSLYAKGENLTDELAYNHLSFLKETAPLAGRQISVGLNIKL